MPLESNLSPQVTQPTATPSPQATPAETPPAPVIVSDSEFGRGAPDIEGVAQDMLGMMDTDDEPSPSQLREQAVAAAAAAAPVAPAAPAVVTPAEASPAPAPVVTPPVVAATPPLDPASVTAPVVAAPVGTPTVAPAVPAAVPPVAATPAVPGTPPDAPVTPGTPPVAAPAATAPPAVADGNPFVQLGQAVRTNRAALEAQLASSTKFTPEQIAEFHEKPEEFLPKLVAKIQLDMVENTFGVMAQQIPVAVSGVMALERQNSQYENQFYQRWPQLQKGNPAHDAVIMQIGRAYVQANPQSDLATRLTHIGAQAVVALNLIPPAAPQAPAPAVVPPVAPFAPAGNGTAAPVPQNGQLQGWELFDQQLASFDS